MVIALVSVHYVVVPLQLDISFLLFKIMFTPQKLISSVNL